MRFLAALASVAIALLLSAPPASADGGLTMVADINPSGSSAPTNFMEMGGVAYFSATDGVTGRELWRSDGTSTGTWLVRDIHHGSASSNPQPIAVVGSVLYFTAKDRAHGQELWKTDGTAAGTHLVKDLVPGALSGGFIYGGVVVGNLLFFYLDLDVPGTWVSDGTDAGTYLVGPGLDYMTAFGDRLYGIHNNHLWRSDGTVSGTKRVGWETRRVWDLGATDNLLYLMSGDGKHCDLYVTDGTKSDVRRLTAQPVEGCQFAVAGQRVFFTNGHHEIWRSDGTARSTKLVSTLTTDMWELWPSEDCVWFNTWDEEGYPAELWRSDGTKAGTVRIDATPLPDASFVVSAGSLYYFAATSIDWSSEPTTTLYLWQSDGTAAGTTQVVNIDTQGSATQELTAAGERVFFWFDDGVHGAELWSYGP